MISIENNEGYIFLYNQLETTFFPLSQILGFEGNSTHISHNDAYRFIKMKYHISANVVRYLRKEALKKWVRFQLINGTYNEKEIIKIANKIEAMSIVKEQAAIIICEKAQADGIKITRKYILENTGLKTHRANNVLYALEKNVDANDYKNPFEEKFLLHMSDEPMNIASDNEENVLALEMSDEPPLGVPYTKEKSDDYLNKKDIENNNKTNKKDTAKIWDRVDKEWVSCTLKKPLFIRLCVFVINFLYRLSASIRVVLTTKRTTTQNKKGIK
jgi:hypothetical protein